MIKWLEVYSDTLTYVREISNQSCHTNFDSPCILELVVHSQIPQMLVMQMSTDVATRHVWLAPQDTYTQYGV